MTPNYYSQHEDRTDSTQHLKDSALKIAVVGCGIPVCLLVVVIANFATGRVYVPSGE